MPSACLFCRPEGVPPEIQVTMSETAAFLLIALIAALHVFSLYSAGHALLHKRDSRAALGWVAVILIVPPLGPFLYWLFGIDRTNSRAVKLMNRAARNIADGDVDLHGRSLEERPAGFVRPEELPPALQRLELPGYRLTGRYPAGGNDIRILHNGEEAYPVMLKAIAEARDRVYLSSFIFGCDEVGLRFAEALTDAAERGCDVRLLMDGVGSFNPLAQWHKRLGPRVHMACFLPPSLVPPQFSINLRTHRKVLVCDEDTAFTGGMNISQHHLVTLPRRDRVQDIHFLCRGPIAQQLALTFLMDWSFVTGETSTPASKPVSRWGRTPCRLLVDGPGSPDEIIHDLICAVISSARHSVRIMSPYFLPPHRLESALTSAVLRGVDVNVILPGENNHRLVDWAMRHQNSLLEESGVHLFYQPPPFAHTKLLLVDGDYTLLGSANLDPRSLNLNFELVMEVFDAGVTADLIAFFDAVKNRSVPVSTDVPALPLRLRNAAAWIASPYL